MARLKVYTVHVNPSLPHPYEAAEFVQEGFNWRAFVFSGFWALYHRLWWQAAALLVYSFVVLNLMASHTLTHLALAVIDFGIHLLIGFEANEWLRTQLKTKGYLTADITTGDSALRAELRFFDRYFAANAGAAA